MFAPIPSYVIQHWVTNPFVLDLEYRLFEYMDGKGSIDCMCVSTDLYRGRQLLTAAGCELLTLSLTSIALSASCTILLFCFPPAISTRGSNSPSAISSPSKTPLSQHLEILFEEKGELSPSLHCDEFCLCFSYQDSRACLSDCVSLCRHCWLAELFFPGLNFVCFCCSSLLRHLLL